MDVSTAGILKKLARTAMLASPALAESRELVQRIMLRFPAMAAEDDLAALALLPEGITRPFLDIGAQRGRSTARLLHHYPGAQVVAVEPNPVAFAGLQAAYGRHPQVALRPIALADTNEPQTLNIPVYGRCALEEAASLDKTVATRQLNGDTVYFFDEDHLRVETCQVDGQRLDNLELDPCFIHIDVPGMEAAILRGGFETLRHGLPLVYIKAMAADDPASKLLAGLEYVRYCFRDGFFYPNLQPKLNSFFLHESHRKLFKDRLFSLLTTGMSLN